MVNEVRFKVGTKEQFNKITPDENTVYFITDTHQLYRGGEIYNLIKPISSRIGEIAVFGDESGTEITNSETTLDELVEYIDAQDRQIVQAIEESTLRWNKLVETTRISADSSMSSAPNVILKKPDGTQVYLNSGNVSEVPVEGCNIVIQAAPSHSGKIQFVGQGSGITTSFDVVPGQSTIQSLDLSYLYKGHIDTYVVKYVHS